MKADSTPSPASEAALLASARALAGRTLAELARAHGWTAPPDLRAAKGWAGRLMEHALGAHATSRGEPDFPRLGVELKTLPLDARGRPRESTWVCHAPPRPERRWADSAVCRKLAAVLWVPIDGVGEVAGRRVHAPRLWRPSAEEVAVLRDDWEALTELLYLGPISALDARVGVALQLRPKAASRTDLAWTLSSDGEWVREVPRGFYLRRSFTSAILASGPPSHP